MRYRESCLETAAKEMELSENLLNQLMPPHIHKAVRVGRPYGESCEVRVLRLFVSTGLVVIQKSLHRQPYKWNMELSLATSLPYLHDQEYLTGLITK